MTHLKDQVVSRDMFDAATARVRDLEVALQTVVTALSRPHDTYPYMLDVDTIAAGLRLNLHELRALVWAAPPPSVSEEPSAAPKAQRIELPAWAKKGEYVMLDGERVVLVAIAAIVDHEDDTRSTGVPVERLSPVPTGSTER